METVTIRDVGPIVEHTMPLQPGVTIVTGDHEAGKSTAIACVAALSGRDVPLTIRDGSAKGMVKGLGTTLSISMKKSTRSGQMDADAVEDKINLDGLVSPNVKDVKAATRHRIKALLSLTGQTLTIRDFAPILPEGLAEQEILAQDFDDDPVEMAGKIKRRMEKKALAIEEKSKDLESKMTGKSSLYVGLDLTAEHDAGVLQDRYTATVRAHEQLKADDEFCKQQAAERLKAKQEIDAAAKAMKDAADLEVELLDAARELTDAGDRQRILIARISDLRQQLEMEERALASIEEQIEARQSAVTAKQEAFEQASSRLELLEKSKAFLATPTKMPPSADDIAAAAESVDAARVAIEQGSRVRDGLKSKEEYKELATEFGRLTEEAEIFRNAAESTNTILSNAVACETLKVIEGDLFYVEGDRRESYARLSDGRRCQVAICEVARAVELGRNRIAVLTLDQKWWDGLNSETRDMVHDTAVGRGIAIVTGQIGPPGSPLSSFLYKSNGK